MLLIIVLKNRKGKTHTKTVITLLYKNTIISSLISAHSCREPTIAHSPQVHGPRVT